MRLITGPLANATVPAWVAARIPFVAEMGFGPGTAIGVIGADEVPLCGVVFHDYQPGFGSISFSIAADSPRWATHNIIRQLLAYPFEELKVQKLWTATPHDNERALRLIKGVGFKREATLYRHFGPATHAIISRMFDGEYKGRYCREHPSNGRQANTTKSA